jgi:hypothetical protein
MARRKTAAPEVVALQDLSPKNHWNRIDELVSAVASGKPTTERIDALLGVFENHPESTDEE